MTCIVAFLQEEVGKEDAATTNQSETKDNYQIQLEIKRANLNMKQLIEKQLIESEESLKRQNELNKMQLNGEPIEDYLKVYEALRKMGFDKTKLCEMMKSDGCTAEVIENLFSECVPYPQNALFSGYSIKKEERGPFRCVYILENSATHEYFRVERHGNKILVMAADRIFFSSNETVHVIETRLKMEKQIVQSNDSLFSVLLQYPEQIDEFDQVLNVLANKGLHPFPDYIMYDLVTAAIFCQLTPVETLSAYSTWQLQTYPILEAPHERRKIRVGIIDDFNSCSYPHGKQCRDIIEIFEFANHGNSGENFESNITFCEYDFLGKIAEMERSGEIEDLHQKFQDITADSLHPHEIEKISRSHISRLSVLFKYLKDAAKDKLNILNICIEWMPSLPKSDFENIILELEKHFMAISKTKCVCVLAAGNSSLNLDDDTQCDKSWITRSLLPCVANKVTNMIVIGASGVFGQYCSFSNYGCQTVRFAAPGECVKLYGNDEFSGTSAAAPIITAIFAMMLYQFPFHDGDLSDLIRRLEDCLDPFIVNNAIGLRTQKCRLEGRINPSKALRKDLIGRYGILEEKELPSEVVPQVLKIQENMHKAERYLTLSLAIESIMGVKRRTEMLEENRNELSAYGTVFDQLESISFTNEIASKWRRFEIDRVDLLTKNKLSEDEADLMETFSNELNLAEEKQGLLFSNESSKEYTTKDIRECHFLYTIALRAVDDVASGLDIDSFLQPLMAHVALWIKNRINRLDSLLKVCLS